MRNILVYFKCRACNFSAKNNYSYCPQCQGKGMAEKEIDDYSSYSYGPKKIANRPAKNPKIIVDSEQCVGSRCGQCAPKCPAKAITIREIAIIDHKKCIKCRKCIPECPNRAIYFTDDLGKAKRMAGEQG